MFRSMDLDKVKAVKDGFAVSVNDVVMAMCADTLRAGWPTTTCCRTIRWSR